MAQDRLQPRPDDPYEVLQVDPGADADVIEAAYRVLARRYHPDRNRSAEATGQMARINGAWELLRDPERRRAYDRSRGLTQPVYPTRSTSPVSRGAPAKTSPGGGPALHLVPEEIAAGRLRRGAARGVAVGVFTEPPGIRVALTVTEGGSWLRVNPALLQELDEDQAQVRIHTARLRPGRHTGAVELSTSWETRLLPVTVDVEPASILYRSLALLRHGPTREGGRAALVALAPPVVLLVAIAVALAIVAVAR
jgi:hypothetical protein